MPSAKWAFITIKLGFIMKRCHVSWGFYGHFGRE